ncbi:MAG: ArsR/SmtB family transcription factor [Actinophytocola sp.]|uniref:ArsR/SmtB family transcription factor n=1 Tax=Actinophytocola sp. TaxID=1872138 RepID=UPI003D6BC6EF
MLERRNGVVLLDALPGEDNPAHPDAHLDALADAAPLFKALSDPIRVKLLALVRQTPTGEACFCDLADEFDMPQSTLSHHLKILVQAGLLSRERRGTWSWYRVRPEPLDLISALLQPGGPFRDDPHRAAP